MIKVESLSSKGKSTIIIMLELETLLDIIMVCSLINRNNLIISGMQSLMICNSIKIEISSYNIGIVIIML